MDYMHADHYAHTDHYSHGHGGDSHFSHISHPYMTGGVDYNPNASFDGHSDHSSHNSLQAPRGGDQSHGPYSSFSPYTGLRMSDDGHASPIPRSASPNTREPSYHNLPAYQEAPLSHYPDHSGVDDSFGPRDEYGGPGVRTSYSGAGDSYHDDGYRQSPTSDLYQTHHPEYLDDHGGAGGPYDESYRHSPFQVQDYPPDELGGRVVENVDQYRDGHQAYPQQLDDSFQREHYSEREGHHDRQMYDQDPYLDSPQQRHSYSHEDYQRQSPTPGVGPPRYTGGYDEDHASQQYDEAEEDGPRYRGSYDREDPGAYRGMALQEGGGRYRGSFDRQGADSFRDGQPPRSRTSYQDGRNSNDSFGEPGRKYDGLPPVRADPFADDPFRDQRSHDGSFTGLRDEEPYHSTQSPAGDMKHADYDTHPYDGHDNADYPPTAAPSYGDYLESQPYLGETEMAFYPDEAERPFYPEEEMQQRFGSMQLAPSATEGYHPDDRRTPSVDGRAPFGDYHRAPDLQEVIEYLSSPDNSIKANAAAYLQHLAFNDDGIKAKTRGLGGIQPLIEMLSNELTEVHRGACGALQNLSFGKANDENKRAIRNLGGVPELIRLLRKTDQEDVMDSVTGILWNLSSCEDLKQVILDDGLSVLVNVVVLPYSGWNGGMSQPSQRPWTTVFRNTTGILRNISSAGYDARKKLRECRGLVNALIHTLQQARDDNNIDCKPVENVVCVLRNLSYRVQEMEDPDFYKKRSLPHGSAPPSKEDKENAGCFGGGKKGAKKISTRENTPQRLPPKLPGSASEYRSLWGNDLIQLYLLILKSCTNPVSIEAAAGAVQNLAACDWEPAVECRAFVRKAKGLPILVDLLSNESNRVVCAAATALRNLTIDEKNKELVGKYSIQQLVAWLPRESRHTANRSPDDLICAVLATLYEVIRSNQDYAVSLIQEDGLSRLKYINTSEGRFLARTLKINHTILKTLWSFKPLHSRYTQMGFTEQDFSTSRATPRPDSYREGVLRSGAPPASNHTTPYNTLSRPISAQGYDDNTLSTGRAPSRVDRMGYGGSYRGSRSDMDGYLQMNQSNAALFDQGQDRPNYSREKIPVESVPMSDMGPGYAPLDEPRPHKKPVGGVPLFPTLPAARGGDRVQQEPRHSPQDLSAVPEPLYAQVNKGRRRNDEYAHTADGAGSGAMLDGSGGRGGADSWV